MEEVIANDCVLKLDHLVFDRISFKRIGFANDNGIDYKFGFGFEEKSEHDIVVHLNVIGQKEEEYKFQVSASGYFTLSSTNYKDLLIRQNAVAIIFPYIRSQISLLTAQPEVTPVVLPPFNIAQMVEDAMNAEVEENPQLKS